MSGVISSSRCCKPVAKQQLALFQALNLQLIDGSNRQERFDGGLEIVMLQPHPLDLRANRGLFGLATIIVHTPVAAAVILPAAPAIRAGIASFAIIASWSGRRQQKAPTSLIANRFRPRGAPKTSHPPSPKALRTSAE